MQNFKLLHILHRVKELDTITHYYKPFKKNYVMKELVEKINAEIEAFKVNAEAQVEKNNKAAGARARKAALELMKDLKEFRKVSVAESNK